MCKITVNEIKFGKYIFFLIKNYAFSSKKNINKISISSKKKIIV